MLVLQDVRRISFRLTGPTRTEPPHTSRSDSPRLINRTANRKKLFPISSRCTFASFNILGHKVHADSRIFYRRRLPHYQPPNETFHVTFRLAGSVPVETVLKLKQEHEEIKKSVQKIKSATEQRKLRHECGASYFSRFDEFADRATDGRFWLSEDSIAAKVAEIIHVQDGKDYDLLAYCLMSNHVHLLATFWEPTTDSAEVDVERSSDRCGLTTGATSKRNERTEVRSTTAQYILTKALRRIKGASAYECNKLLNRRGAFWHHESYDHMVRNEAELQRTIWYILENPVKAGLCRDWRDWKWSYVKKGMIKQWD